MRGGKVINRDARTIYRCAIVAEFADLHRSRRDDSISLTCYQVQRQGQQLIISQLDLRAQTEFLPATCHVLSFSN